MTTRLSADRAAAAIERACTTTTNADDLLEQVAYELGRAVPFDGSMWLGVDPATLLATAPGRIHGVGPGECTPFWDREFQVQDFLLYRDLARQEVPADSLRNVTDDQPRRSTRYREFLSPQGYGDELRAVFRSGDNAWGVLGLYREKGRPAFDKNEVALVDTIAGSLAKAMRNYVAAARPWSGAATTPGLLVFTRDAKLLSSNAEAIQWLEELEGFSGPADARSNDWIRSLCDAGIADCRVPPALIVLIARAKAVAEGLERGPARLRLRGRNSRWLVLHASCLQGPDTGTVAVVIEPAKSAEIAPIIIEAYALTTRERDVVREIAHGLATAEIAAKLCLSTHTVRDYVKSVFEKVGVSSRGELVAKLFAEHYSEPLHAAVSQHG